MGCTRANRSEASLRWRNEAWLRDKQKGFCCLFVIVKTFFFPEDQAS
jgi:hypothetical protein